MELLSKSEDLEMSDGDGLRGRIRSFIVKKFPIAKKRGLNDELPLLQTGIVDSLGVLDIVGFLEQAFHIRIDDDELTPDNFANVRCMAAFVERKTGVEVSAQPMSPSA
jgi:acyl carrier protein